MIKNTIILSLILISINSISIPVSTDDYRCMVVYSSTPDQNIKIDVRFPKIPQIKKHDNHDEYFVIWVNNTQTFQSDFYRVEPGQTFRRQLNLEPTIMYKVCFRINSTSQRHIGPLDVEYESYHVYQIMNHDRHNIKVPDSILKQNDLKQSYNDILLMLDMTQRQLQLNKMHKNDESKHFEAIQSTTKNLMLISAVQIMFILIVAGIQYVVIKKHLTGQLRL